ncbi:transposase domain-containing protein [Blastochloris tepida]|uniref:transposase domain-containing protein n=1 Tax=Blastochloris tepida TaxID=2233851 RepID=UPI00135AF80D|nr:transposase domain-containing protein [Blastochloris tepida]
MLVSSLPLGLQLEFKALQSPVEAPSKGRHHDKDSWGWWSFHVAEALRHEKGSPERAAAVAALAARSDLTDWRGRPITLSERTIQRKIKALEDGGLAALGRKRRADAGAKKAIITRAWDGAVPFDDAEKLRIRERLDQHIRNLWGNGGALSMVRRLAGEWLADTTRLAGFDPGPDDLARLCQLPQHLVERGKRARKVHVFNTDRKTFEDGKRRVRRTIEGLQPMDVVVGDVHPVDVLVRREDGSTATPRAIAWLDVATGRVRMTFLLFEKGRGVRNEDVARSFLDMVRDPAWGVPRHLYLDNGAEYNWADFIEDAMKVINGPVEYFTRSSPIIKAKPYNAAAKPIEGIFAVLEKTVFNVLEGHIGGDRLRKKSANVGRPPAPFPGTWADFCQKAEGLVSYYNTNPQRGRLGGLTPNQMLRRAQEAGWRAATIDPMALLQAFTVREARTPDRGCIAVKGRPFTCDGLSLYNGEKVEVAIPRYGEIQVVAVFAPDGTFIGAAREDRPFHFLDPEGAAEAARRDKVDRQLIADLRKTVEPIDIAGLAVESGRRAAGLPAPMPADVLPISDRTATVARALAETPEEALRRIQRERDAAINRRLAQIEREKIERQKEAS